MAPDFLIDGMLSGTGVRDAKKGGYVDLADLGISARSVKDITDWQQEYEEAHFADFPDDLVAELDERGLALAARIASELSGKNVGYFSNGRMTRLS